MAIAEAQTGSKVSDSEQAGGGTASDHPSPQVLTSKDHDLGGKEEVIFQCYERNGGRQLLESPNITQ